MSFSKLFFLYKDIREKRVSALSTTTPTRCQRGQQQRLHSASVVKDNADILSA